METIITNKRRKLYAALLWTLLFVFLLAYNRTTISNFINPKPKVVVNSPNSLRANNPWNQFHADSSLSIVANGDLVVRAGSDAISLLFIKANSHDKTFSHAGIVFFENGYPMVYNSIASAEEPNAKVSRDSLKSFIDPHSNTAYSIYRYKLNKPEIEQMHQTLMQYYREERRFDPHFDLETDSLLYCSEIIYKALQETTGQKDYLSTTKAGAFEFVAIDNLYQKAGTKLICKIVYKQ